MAPVTSKALHPDILNALQNAAKRRNKITVVRKEQQAKKLGAQGYHKMRKKLSRTKFIPPLDADTTQANIYYIKRRFIRFCHENKHGPWIKVIKTKNCDKGFIMTFLHWICKTYLQLRRKRSKKKTVNQYWRDFKMLYRRANKGRVVNANDGEEVVKYINGTLRVEFDLDVLPKPKPVMGVDDLLLGLTHHWSRDRSIFPTEDDRLDVPTIMLFQAYTACRPAELVDGSKSRGGKDPLLDEPGDQCPNGDSVSDSVVTEDNDPVFNDTDGYDSDVTDDTDLGGEDLDDTGSNGNAEAVDADNSNDTEVDEFGDPIRKHKVLCYEDITLWIVKDPKQGGRDILAMEVYFRYHKGADNKPKPTIFLFREHPLAILCPISYILARAIRDDAIQVDGYSRAEPFFSTQLGKGAVKVHWKSSKLKTPIFRTSIRAASGRWEKSGTKPMKYSTYAFYLDRIGTDLGSEEKWTSYCMRRGNVNAILDKAPDAVVDQVMRHDPMTGCLANAYLNHRVGFNVQDAFLERDPSADGLTRAFTHMSIRCNPEVPKEIPKTELDGLPPDPEIVDLSRRVRQMSIGIRQEYRFIKFAPKPVHDRYRQLQRDLRNAEKSFRDEMTKVYQEACRRRIHDEELERQLSGMVVDEEAEPAVQHYLEERNQLQAILCDFNMNLDIKCITDRKIRAINLIVVLASRREIRQPRSSQPCEDKRTQCIYCVGDETLLYKDRMHTFSRVSHMMDHVENVHLKHEPVGGKFVCHHPDCKPLGNFLRDLDEFKNHVQKVHGVKLRK
ncbi:hypothetical protein K469DRAFT_729448 [Zopfia rhizophila CBS 207.26]|uniref:FluG domain-containing protein n=1 Tax=Zopfia rhizophila CBS 207.26 TaxID=1314779 RepID=A0A6A6DP12_9PEZI|nr:hypothetical protein K469DRAFT_729448 [Zopfia rhizophila CBS 207.26]